MTRSAPFPSITPPRPEKRPVSDTHHGVTRTDDYAWLRAANWQEVFRDPSVLDPEIRAHLEAENAYQAALMADTADLQKALFAEMKGRIKEDDSSVPMKDGPYAYGSSFRLGGEQPRYFRTPREGGEEAILLDGDAEAAGKAYFRLGGIDHSPDHRRLLWAYDDKGSEFYTLRVRNLEDGGDLGELVADTGGSGAWTAGSDGFFYTRLDPNHRPSKLFFHAVGTDPAQDRLIYEETDPGFFMNVGGTRSNEWILIGINDHETSEYRILPADEPSAEPKLVAARENGLQYDLEEGGDIFFVLTNADGAKDFKIMTA
ncbi:MAG TPA: S9 family peptidase, partial [Mesorhizobium sp.]|nr:S9 family peptidase [Mesorhizobium sp.]